MLPAEQMESLVLLLYEIGAVQIGNFTLHSGRQSPVYSALTPVGGSPVWETDGEQHTLIIVFSQVDCNECLDANVGFLNDLHRKASPGLSIKSIGVSSATEYLRRFKRVNRMKFPMYESTRETLGLHLGVQVGPILLLVNNETGKIVSSHHPTPDKKKRSEAYRDFLTKLFEAT